uniref:glycosyltransferase family 4 protein n=1 Tax=Albibacillus kandeliae TaxID=2174228 RepID=UPI001E53074E|nr:glycosyltransferase family 4 protein [Albibacillus kandeliae]
MLIGPEERAAAADTFFIVPAGKSPGAVLGALGATLAAPGRLGRTLALSWRTAQPGLKGGLKQLAYLAEAMLLARHLRHRGVQQIHCHFVTAPGHVTLLASELSGIPFSFTMHGPSELFEPETWQLAAKTEKATFVACISHFARSQMMYLSGPAHWAKMKIVHCGVIPERYDAPAPEARQEGVAFVFVGRLTAIKGVGVLLEAFRRALETRPDLRLTLVGDGDDRARLERLAAPLGGAVRFTGYQSQAGVAENLARADALVLPSFAEGLPVVLMEALASARPVIATRVAGVSELVEDGVNGLTVHAGDAEGLAEALLRLAGDPELRARMGEAGRRKVRAEFDVRREAARLATLFAGRGGDALRPLPLSDPKEH